jgi:RNA polymerase sigma-70 factor (ECF subfamily)
MTGPNVNLNSPEDSTCSSLLERVRSKDQTAWDRLVKLYSPLIYLWCRRASLQEADAADVGQEVFRAVARNILNLEHGQPGDSFRGWLRTITRNKILDRVRGSHGGVVGSGGDEGQDLLLRVPAEASDSGSSEDSLESKVLFQRAVALVRTDFGENTWQVFQKVTLEGQRPADVAQELGLTLNAVYLAKSRVLRRLREEFDGLVDIG